MSQQVLGASPFLTGFRRLHAARKKLSEVREGGATIPLVTVLDAWGIDGTRFRRQLIELEADGLEVVVRRACRSEK